MASQSSKNQNKTILATTILLVIIGLISYFIFLRPSQQPITQSNPTISTSQLNDDRQSLDPQDGKPATTQLSSASYIVYSPERFQQASSSKRVLFFYANWCPTCSPADQDFIQNIEGIPQGVAVFRVNYNDSDTDENEKALAKQYGVTYQHTFVQIDSQGNEVAKWNGGQTEELTQNLK